MKRFDYSSIVVPLEFKVACTINKLNIQQVLQIFMDHVSLYDSLTNEYSEGFTEATKAVSIYVLSKEKQRKPSKSFDKCKDLAINCISGIIQLIKMKEGSLEERRMKSSPQITSLYKSMVRYYTPVDRIHLDEDLSISLSRDFCIACEMHSCYPKELLEYFMSRISLADEHARLGLKLLEQNHPYALFLRISEGFENDVTKVPELTDLEMDFYFSHYQNMTS